LKNKKEKKVFNFTKDKKKKTNLSKPIIAQIHNSIHENRITLQKKTKYKGQFLTNSLPKYKNKIKINFKKVTKKNSIKNLGNFLEMIKLLASQVGVLVFGNAPQNIKYTSHEIQKENLNVFTRNVQSLIRREIGDEKICLIVDEARDETRREQITFVIRFVAKIDLYENIFWI
jgi:phage-related protein